MENILIIGGGGFIGQHLSKKIIEKGYSLTILLPNKEKIFNLEFMKKAKLIEGSITNFELVKEVIKEKDFIINLATMMGNERGREGIIKSLKLNCLGELNVLESIKKINPKGHHIFLGTRAQFGKVGKNGKLVDEKQEQNPTSFYGIHKQTCERYIKYYQKIYGLNIVSLRPIGVYGPILMGKSKNVLNIFIENCLNNKDLIINGDGSQINDFIYINDLIDLILEIIEKKVIGIYNVGSGKGFPMTKIAQKIKKLCNSNSLIKNRKLSAEEEFLELDGVVMEISKIKNATAWHPKISLEKGLIETINFYKDSKIDK